MQLLQLAADATAAAINLLKPLSTRTGARRRNRAAAANVEHTARSYFRSPLWQPDKEQKELQL